MQGDEAESTVDCSIRLLTSAATTATQPKTQNSEPKTERLLPPEPQSSAGPELDQRLERATDINLQIHGGAQLRVHRAAGQMNVRRAAFGIAAGCEGDFEQAR